MNDIKDVTKQKMKENRTMIRVELKSNEPIERAMRRFRKICDREGITRDLRKNEYYEKPSEKNKRAERESEKARAKEERQELKRKRKNRERRKKQLKAARRFANKQQES